MQTKAIIIEVTPDDMFEILFAFEEQIKTEISNTEKFGKITKHNYQTALDCYELVRDLTNSYRYSFTLPYTKFSDYESVQYIDDFIEKLVDLRDKKARVEAKKGKVL